MKDPTSIHPLAQKRKRSGKIRFMREGKEHCFYSCINRLTGSRLSAFDANSPSIDDSVSWVKTVFKSLREDPRVTVIESIGDF
jgi:hypothetical protein